MRIMPFGSSNAGVTKQFAYRSYVDACCKQPAGERISEPVRMAMNFSNTTDPVKTSPDVLTGSSDVTIARPERVTGNVAGNEQPGCEIPADQDLNSGIGFVLNPTDVIAIDEFFPERNDVADSEAGGKEGIKEQAQPVLNQRSSARIIRKDAIDSSVQPADLDFIKRHGTTRNNARWAECREWTLRYGTTVNQPAPKDSEDGYLFSDAARRKLRALIDAGYIVSFDSGHVTFGINTAEGPGVAVKGGFLYRFQTTLSDEFGGTEAEFENLLAAVAALYRVLR